MNKKKILNYPRGSVKRSSSSPALLAFYHYLFICSETRTKNPQFLFKWKILSNSEYRSIIYLLANSDFWGFVFFFPENALKYPSMNCCITIVRLQDWKKLTLPNITGQIIFINYMGSSMQDVKLSNWNSTIPLCTLITYYLWIKHADTSPICQPKDYLMENN